MSSILQTDVIELFNTWGERVAFNEGYQAQKISSARQGGRDAFNLGLSRSEGQRAYLAADHAASVDVAGAVDDVGEVDDPGEVDDLGEVDGEVFINECVLCGDRFESPVDLFDAGVCQSCYVSIHGHDIEVYGLHDTFDMFMTDEEKAEWIERDMVEASYMDMWNDSVEYDANTAY